MESTPKKTVDTKIIRVDVKDWETPKALEKIYDWCINGLSVAQIAKNIGISSSTWYIWLKTNDKIRETVLQGKRHSDDQVENALYKHCIEDRDTRSMIFWLKNRRPDKWSERFETENTNRNEDVIVLEIR